MSDEAFFFFFLCPYCHTEIEATLDMVGEETECPACGAKITVPQANAQGGNGCDDPLQSAIKSRTIRIELEDI